MCRHSLEHRLWKDRKIFIFVPTRLGTGKAKTLSKVLDPTISRGPLCPVRAPFEPFHDSHVVILRLSYHTALASSQYLSVYHGKVRDAVQQQPANLWYPLQRPSVLVRQVSPRGINNAQVCPPRHPGHEGGEDNTHLHYSSLNIRSWEIFSLLYPSPCCVPCKLKLLLQSLTSTSNSPPARNHLRRCFFSLEDPTSHILI